MGIHAHSCMCIYKSLMLSYSLSSTADALLSAPNDDQTVVTHVLPELWASHGSKPGAHVCATPITRNDGKGPELSRADLKRAGKVESKKSPIIVVSASGAYTCTLCRRHFKSQHAVDIHLSRNDECRRRKATLGGASLPSQRLFGN